LCRHPVTGAPCEGGSELCGFCLLQRGEACSFQEACIPPLACLGGVCQDCVELQGICDATAPTCCPGGPYSTIECSYEANSSQTQGEARCCMTIGSSSCTDRDDCCSNADCVQGRCCLDNGQQCTSDDECCHSACVDGVCAGSCVADGEACTDDVECCGFHCVGKVCS
jgi:hypothetical protein